MKEKSIDRLSMITNTKIKTTTKANARIFDTVMYPALKQEKLHRIRNTSEGAVTTL